MFRSCLKHFLNSHLSYSAKYTLSKCYKNTLLQESKRYAVFTHQTVVCIHSSAPCYLELAHETLEEWEEDFANRKKSSYAGVLKQGIKFFSLSVLHLMRYVSFTLIKEGSSFQLPDAEHRDNSCFESPDVIATTFLSRYSRFPGIVIENKYHPADYWESIVRQIEENSSSTRNCAVSSLFEFVMLSDLYTIKCDYRCDPDEHLYSPIVSSYIDFLFSSPETIDVCQRSLMLLISRYKRMSEPDIKSIEEIYGRAKQHVTVFSPDLLHMIMEDLSDTKYWRDIYDAIDIIMSTKMKYSVKAYGAVIIAALRNGEEEVALKVLKRFLEEGAPQGKDVSMLNKILIEMLQVFSYSDDREIWSRNKEVIEVLFTSLRNLPYFPTDMETTLAIANWFTSIKDENWQYKLIGSSEIRGTECPFTNVALEEKRLTDSEYDLLAQMIFNHVIRIKINFKETLPSNLQRDTFLSTYPMEIKSFMTMLLDNGPYDLVVDGLNMMYNMKQMGKNTHHDMLVSMDRQLQKIVHRRAQEFGRRPKVLIIFREFIRKLYIMKELFRSYSDIWYSSNDSSDDPFFMCAAVMSGRDCNIISQDLLRNSKALIGSGSNKHMAHLLFRWQQIHQYAIFANPKRQLFENCIQRTENTWHIPCIINEQRSNELPNTWLCLKRME